LFGKLDQGTISWRPELAQRVAMTFSYPKHSDTWEFGLMSCNGSMVVVIATQAVTRPDVVLLSKGECLTRRGTSLVHLCNQVGLVDG
jgi:hypothetical protein